jgi:Cytochrome c-type biogenesis protein CcmE|tara:strand:- start:4044 stop:4469 length:426 start_codon:yes stop_codon:yes gene_type:complete
MYGKKVKLRIIYLSLIFIIISLSIFLILKSLEENVVYFISPSEIKILSEINRSEKIRVGGMVKNNSVQMTQNKITFIITDYKNEINVSYLGAIPNLFSEGKGVVAEGFLQDRNFLNADKILAKHDENYMPPEVKKALEKTE